MNKGGKMLAELILKKVANPLPSQAQSRIKLSGVLCTPMVSRVLTIPHQYVPIFLGGEPIRLCSEEA